MSQRNDTDEREMREPSIGSAIGPHAEEQTLSAAPLLRRESLVNDDSAISESAGTTLDGVADVGAQLRAARIRLSMEIDELARQTRLKAQLISAIERGETQSIPDAYLRGYVRTLAAALDVNSRPLIDALGQPTTVPLVANIADHHRRKRHQARGAKSRKGLWLLLIGLAVIVGGVTFTWPALKPTTLPWIEQWSERVEAFVADVRFPDGARDSVDPSREADELAASSRDGSSASAEDDSISLRVVGSIPDQIERMPPVSLARDESTDEAVANQRSETAGTETPPTAVLSSDERQAQADPSRPGGAETPVDQRSRDRAPEKESPDEPAPRTPSAADDGASSDDVGVDSALSQADDDSGRRVDSVDPARPELIAAAMAEGRAALRLVVTEPSWVDIRSADRERVVSEILAPGVDQVFVAEYPVRVVIGFVPGVTIEWNGEPFDLSPHSRGDATARFSLQAP